MRGKDQAPFYGFILVRGIVVLLGMKSMREDDERLLFGQIFALRDRLPLGQVPMKNVSIGHRTVSLQLNAYGERKSELSFTLQCTQTVTILSRQPFFETTDT